MLRSANAQGTVGGPGGSVIAYETHGSGPPLLLIAGFGASRAIWQPQLADWAQHRQVITMDNRNAGKSRGPGFVPRIELMAGDALAVLDGLGIEEADICGMSMGGMIAQVIAMRHPERVRRLVLTCTAPCRPMPRPFGPGGPVGMLFSPGFAAAHPEAVQEWLKIGQAAPTSVMLRQAIAIMAYDLRREVPGLRLPVLVAHGSGDRVVPVRNGQWLAAHIPGAQLVIYEGAGHGMTIERTRDYNRDVLRFLLEEGS